MSCNGQLCCDCVDQLKRDLRKANENARHTLALASEVKKFRKALEECLSNCGCEEYTTTPCANCLRIEAALE